MKYDPKWRDATFRPPIRRRDKESWFDCLKRHCDMYGVDHFRVLELYQSLRQSGASSDRAASDAAWAHGLTDEEGAHES
jgi:hypothetical protein